MGATADKAIEILTWCCGWCGTLTSSSVCNRCLMAVVPSMLGTLDKRSLIRAHRSSCGHICPDETLYAVWPTTLKLYQLNYSSEQERLQRYGLNWAINDSVEGSYLVKVCSGTPHLELHIEHGAANYAQP